MNLTGRILDIYDDREEAGLVKEAAQAEMLPSWVMAETLPESLDDVPDALFAFVDTDVHGNHIRKFAAHNKANAWLSNLYFLKNGHAFDEGTQQKIAGRLVVFADVHEIDTPDLLVKVASGESALEPEYVSAVGDVNDPEKWGLWRGTESKYPLFTEEHVKLAGDYLAENYRFPPQERREFACKIVKRAEEMDKEATFTTQVARAGASHLGPKMGLDRPFKASIPQPKPPKAKPSPTWGSFAQKQPKAKSGFAQAKATPQAKPQVKAMPKLSSELPAVIHKMAGENLSNHLWQALNDRYNHLDDDSTEKQALELLASNIEHYTLDKVASILENIDREAGLDKLWDNQITDPILSVYDFEKDASENQLDAGGVPVTEGQLKKLAGMKEKIASHFDSYFADSFATDPVTIFKSLPTPDKQALAEMAQGL